MRDTNPTRERGLLDRIELPDGLQKSFVRLSGNSEGRLPWVPRLSLLNRALNGSATVISSRKEHG
jgi:hypothetical protein